MKLAEKLLMANDGKRSRAASRKVWKMRHQALAPTLAQLVEAGPAIIPYLLPLTYTFLLGLLVRARSVVCTGNG